MIRILTYAFFLAPPLAFGQSLQEVLASSLQSFNKIGNFVNIDPCGLSEKLVKPKNCGGIPHCAVDSSKYDSFCFNGEEIQDGGKGANKLMLEFLCTDSDFPPLPDIGLSFGPCNGEKEILTYRQDSREILCHCDSNVFKCMSILKEI